MIFSTLVFVEFFEILTREKWPRNFQQDHGVVEPFVSVQVYFFRFFLSTLQYKFFVQLQATLSWNDSSPYCSSKVFIKSQLLLLLFFIFICVKHLRTNFIFSKLFHLYKTCVINCYLFDLFIDGVNLTPSIIDQILIGAC